MAKITTIIDIGSNSMRMVVFVKTSRYAFHLINETKSKIKISQNAYLNNNELQEEPMRRAFLALKSFLNIAKNLKSRKILCVATSALRDAPNKNEFLLKVKKELGLNIKIIEGKKEAYLGGVAANNLIQCKYNFFTIDIGGGSTEFSLKLNNEIKDTISLKIGTVRLHELFFDKEDINGAKEYVFKQLQSLPEGFLEVNTIVGLGGTIRSLSTAIIANSNYPLDDIHGFTYEVNEYEDFFKQIINANTNKELKKLGFRKDRHDTIKIGTFIFYTILQYLDVKNVITSRAGVREGLYLTDLLRTSNHKFPHNYNISVRSLLDRFTFDDKQTSYLGTNISKIFKALEPVHQLNEKYKSYLVVSSKLQQIGISLNYYKNSSHGSNFILNALSYGFTHEQRILIAKIIKYSKNDLVKKDDIYEYKDLLPNIHKLQWLCFMHSLNKILNSEFSKINYTYKLENDYLFIICDKIPYLIENQLNKLNTPSDLNIRIST